MRKRSTWKRKRRKRKRSEWKSRRRERRRGEGVGGGVYNYYIGGERREVLEEK